MQDSSGAFGVWGPSTADLWLTAYVTDFLTRAKEAGYKVQGKASTARSTGCRTSSRYAEDFDKGGEDRAYALYVLARNGRAPIGELRYYADTRIDRFSTPLAKAQIGAALAMMGDKERAERAFATALAAMADGDARQRLSQRLRLDVARRRGPRDAGRRNRHRQSETPKLATVIAKAYETRSYTSTQEQAWMLLAAKALNDEVKGTKLAVDGEPVNGPVLRGLSPARIEERRPDRHQQRRCRRRCRHLRHRRGVDAGAGRLEGLQNRAPSLHARRQEDRS